MRARKPTQSSRSRFQVGLGTVRARIEEGENAARVLLADAHRAGNQDIAWQVRAALTELGGLKTGLASRRAGGSSGVVSISPRT